MSKHTPGPWEVCFGSMPTGRRGNRWVRRSDPKSDTDEHAICLVYQRPGESKECSDANAHLIAAAPDLLAIARQYVAMCEDTFYDMEDMSPESKQLYDDAKTTIAKAESPAGEPR